MTVMHDEEPRLEPSAEETRNDAQPEWVVAELPEQYADIARQMAALKERARAYEGVAGVLWQRGSALTSSVRDLFIALGFEAELAEYGANCDLRVNLGSERRLLIGVVSEDHSLDRRSVHIGRVLKTLQEEAGDRDRVVLAANVFPDLALSSRRGEPVTSDAIRLIQGMGANLVPTSTLFGIWKQSLENPEEAKHNVVKLYAMDGGIFR
jgi:hypothetical protein